MTKSDDEIVEAMLVAANDAANDDDTDPALAMLAAYRVARAHVLDEAAQIARDALEQAQVSAYGGIAYARIMDMKDRTP